MNANGVSWCISEEYGRKPRVSGLLRSAGLSPKRCVSSKKVCKRRKPGNRMIGDDNALISIENFVGPPGLEQGANGL